MAHKKKQLFIVEDTPANIDILFTVLGDEYDLRVAVSGEIALEALAQGELPDLVLLDIMLPGIDGYEVCRRLKKDPRTRDLCIIFLTALDDSGDQARGFNLGAVDYITKPFDPLVVRARVRTQLELKSYRDQLEEQVRKRTEALVHAQEATIASMAVIAEYRDPETGEHVQRTREYVRLLTRELGREFPDICNELQCDVLAQAAPLHDIGKVAIPDAVLLKTGRLDEEEFAIMQQHTLFGSEAIKRTMQICGPSQLLHTGAEIAEFHHEKWDGSGYPHGLRGDEIPLPARIMAVADVYDALISKRPYKKALEHERAVEIILNGDGYTSPEHFDPRVLDCFERINGALLEIARRVAD